MKRYIYGTKKLFPNVLLAIFIMMLVSAIFGKDCAVIGLILLFFQLMSKGTPFSTEKFIRSAVIMIIVTLLATLAELSVPLLILFSFLVPYFIVILTSDDYDPKGYFIYGLTYFLIQTGEVSSYTALPKNLAALLLGLFIIYIYDYINHKKNNTNNSPKILLQGYQNLINQAKNIKDNKEFNKSILEITTPLNTQLYKQIHEKKGILNNQETKYFQTVLFLEKMESLLKQLKKDKNYKKEQNQKYLQEYIKLLEELLNIKEKKEAIQKIEVFLEQNKLTNNELNEDFRYTLKKLKHILKESSNTEKKVSLDEFFHIQGVHLRNNQSLNTTQTRFAIRLSLALLISTIIALMISITTGFDKSYWLPITTYSLMLQFSEEEKNKIKDYFLGTILGAIVFTIIFRYIPESFGIIFMMLAFTILFLMQSEVLRAVVGSQLALVLTNSTTGDLEVVIARILTVLVACIITYIIDRTILHTKKQHLIHNQVSHLLNKDRRLLKELRRALFSHNLEFRYLDELILESYLTETLIYKLEQEQKNSKEKELTLEVLKYNRDFILNIEQLITMFNTNANLTYENYHQVVIQIDEMEHALEIILLEWNHKRKRRIDETVFKNKLEVENETLYIENRLKNCTQMIEKIKERLNMQKIL